MNITGCVYYERPVATFQLSDFTTAASWIHNFNSLNSRIHEFTISTSRIHDLNFMNSIFYEFTISTSQTMLNEGYKNAFKSILGSISILVDTYHCQNTNFGLVSSGYDYYHVNKFCTHITNAISFYWWKIRQINLQT